MRSSPLILLLSVIPIVALSADDPAARKANVVVFLSDDQGKVDRVQRSVGEGANIERKLNAAAARQRRPA